MNGVNFAKWPAWHVYFLGWNRIKLTLNFNGNWCGDEGRGSENIGDIISSGFVISVF